MINHDLLDMRDGETVKQWHRRRALKRRNDQISITSGAWGSNCQICHFGNDPVAHIAIETDQGKIWACICIDCVKRIADHADRVIGKLS